jgi:UDP:flavonoid glycosyltransferase YjiC (YdhE family)
MGAIRMGTGFRYPLNFRDTIYTIFTHIIMIAWVFVLDPTIRRLNKARHLAGFRGQLGVLAQKSGKILTMSSDPRLEYPYIVPDNISLCGPVVLPNLPVAEYDADLARWLYEGPIILIVLGSHTALTEDAQRQFQQCLSVVLDRRKDLRVLWKIQNPSGVHIHFDGADIADRSRVRIVDWLKPMPISILQSGQVAVFVHHGGSNSYHEGLV